MKVKNRVISSYITAFFSVLIFLLPGYVLASDVAGRIVSLYGDVWVSTGPQNPWRKISESQNLYIGSTVKTGRLSGVNMRMEDESLIRLSQTSEFKVEGVRISSFWRRATSLVSGLNRGVKSTYRLLTGKLWGRNNNRRLNSKVITTTATIGIRGTEYSIEANEEFSSVTIMEGVVLAENEQGQITINSGEQAITRAGQAPQKSTIVQTGESVQWTVQVPELIDLHLYLKRSVSDKRVTAQIYDAYQDTQLSSAQNLVNEELIKNPDNTDLNIVNAWLNIKAGETRTAYQQLSKLSSNDSALLEMKAFSAFLIGKLEEANRIIAQLKKQDSLSDMGWVVSGYLSQANYDLPAAKKAYEMALEKNTKNQLARVQLATLYFGSEQEQRALNLVHTSLRARPGFLPATNLKGFIQLSQNEISTAIKTWQQAESTGNANAETYFGLSLAYMRKGKVEEAMQSIATAVLLDPQRSMYLSYWGKMLNQIGRNDKALTVLDSAIRLDKNDPTPLLYKAIILRDLNRPGEAIKNIQAAVNLNDNKGVYRSRSLLDKDLAVQNVDLSRLFTQLGLGEWAHKKAMDSIKLDFTNSAAHISNAGAYAEMSDRGFALQSEALLSRLMQPANINSFASYLGHTSLYDLPGNEFNLAVGVGNHAQKNLSLITAGANPAKQMAWSLVAQHEGNDGWRDNNGDTFDNLSMIGKWQPDQKNNVTVSISTFESEMLDDVYPRYEINSLPDEESIVEDSILELGVGLHHKVNNHHDLLAYFTILERTYDQIDGYEEDIPVGTDILLRKGFDDFYFERPYSHLQLQGLYRYNNHQLFYGLMALKGEMVSELDDNFKLLDPFNNVISETVFSSSYDLDVSFTSLYVQDSWKITPTIQLDIAAYFEEMENSNPRTGTEWTQEETTGRLGLIWNMNKNHIFRLASFETLLPFVSSRLDPTDIAGIPIFRNTFEGSLISESDLVWDFEWGNGLISTTFYRVEGFTTGAEFMGGKLVKEVAESKQEGFSISFNSLLGLTTGLAFKLSDFEVESEALPSYDREETNAVLGVSHMHTSGLVASIKQVHRNITFDSNRGDEAINVTNLSLSYDFSNKTQLVEFEVSNLFDQAFNWVTDEFTTSGIAPERLFTLKYTVSF